MSRRKSLHELINDTIRNRLSEVHIALPASVQTYSAAKRQASVKPLLARKLKDATVLDIPIINNVPVVWPGSSAGGLFLPLVKGDTVLLIFSERSLDEWLNEGGQVTPEDSRRHDLSDAIAIPGLFSFNTDIGADTNDLRLKFNDSEIRIAKNGDIKLNAGPTGKLALGNAGEELLDLFNQVLTQLIASTTATSIGPQPLSVVAQLTTIQTSLATIKGTL